MWGSAAAAHSMKLSMHCSWAALKITWLLEVCSYRLCRKLASSAHYAPQHSLTLLCGFTWPTTEFLSFPTASTLCVCLYIHITLHYICMLLDYIIFFPHPDKQPPHVCRPWIRTFVIQKIALSYVTHPLLTLRPTICTAMNGWAALSSRSLFTSY